MEPSDLKAGDVLLSVGEGPISEWIIKLTGGDYSHSALFDGKEVYESIKAGVVHCSLKEHVDAQTGGVDVYRFKSGNHRLGDPGWSAEPILNVSKHYFEIGTKFSFEQLFLLIPLVVQRRIPGQPKELRIFLRFLLDSAAGMINDVMAAGKQPMTCSELVFRCFAEAEPQPKYKLVLRDFRRMLPFTAPDDPEIKKLLQQADEVAQAYFNSKGHPLPGPGQPPEFSPPVIADFVSPADLQRSLNLEEIGFLSEPRII